MLGIGISFLVFFLLFPEFVHDFVDGFFDVIDPLSHFVDCRRCCQTFPRTAPASASAYSARKHSALWWRGLPHFSCPSSNFKIYQLLITNLFLILIIWKSIIFIFSFLPFGSCSRMVPGSEQSTLPSSPCTELSPTPSKTGCTRFASLPPSRLRILPERVRTVFSPKHRFS